jgi:hypothetical protein
MDPADAIDQLKAVLVTTEDLLTFCENTNTLPPPSLLGGIRRTWEIIKGQKHLAPPECPGAEEQAIRHYDREHAASLMAQLRRTLSGLKAGDTRVGLQRVSRPIDLEDWGARWKSNSDWAQSSATRLGDRELQGELDALNAEWKDFVAVEKLSQAEPPNESKPAAPQEPRTQGSSKVRLRVKVSEGVVLIDDIKRVIAPQPLKLLCILAEKTKQYSGYISAKDLQANLRNGHFHIARPIRDVIRDLRNALEGIEEKRMDLRNLIEGRPKLGYKLALTREQIELE